MKIKYSFQWFYRHKGLLALVLLYLVSAPLYASNYPLQIIQPQPNLDVQNRFYKAYPGLEYNVRLAVSGGAYPYEFKLDAAPAGMTIDKRGEITWPNPPAAGTPYTVQVSVTDMELTTTNVTWTITVTTSGFRFLDAINGKSAAQGGTGSIDNPWKSVADFYEGNVYDSKYANSYSGEFLYWRTGTYGMDGYTEPSGKDRAIPFINNRKPNVWLAYPGEKPVLDLSAGNISIYSGGRNTYIDGFEINVNNNGNGMGITVPSSANNVTFRRNNIYGINNGYSGGNCSLLFITNAKKDGSFFSIQDNEMHDVYWGYAVLGYSAKNVLVEDNLVYNISRGHSLSAKMGTQLWTFRANRLMNNSKTSINIQYYNDAFESGNIEILHNIIEAGGGPMVFNTTFTARGGPVHVYRNTIMDTITANNITATNGMFRFYDNVIVNDIQNQNKITTVELLDPSRFIVQNNLTGSLTTKIVDSQGVLTASYEQYVGVRGHQLTARPARPTEVIVVTQ
ncbi:MAG: putative Ig domain-containing protein [Gammaproteobacteria bacterium]|nr:putative Ig domain-containing protein [Gammaproteobacteria bacterium]